MAFEENPVETETVILIATLFPSSRDKQTKISDFILCLQAEK